jgi:general stress protein 26
MHQDTHADLEKLGELIGDIRIAMLTSIDDDGSLHTRPLATAKFENDGFLWFLTSIDSAKVDEVERDMRVSVAYAHPTRQAYVAVAGTAEVLQDRSRIHDLWSPMARAWFPEGADDPNLAVLRVRIERAEFWDSPGRAAYLFEAARATVTGKHSELGENRKLSLE